MSKNKIIAVIGPTASGKTDLAIKIANKIDGELINTDSRQIYKFMDIGTAKGDISKLPISSFQLSSNYQLTKPAINQLHIYKLEEVPIHLVNIVEPDEILTLAQYQKLAYASIEYILKQHKIPILVGGTGLYIDAITKGYIMPKVKPNMKLRKELNSLKIEQLQSKLIKLNEELFERLNNSDKNNPHRIIRLIELESLSKDQDRKKSKKPSFDVLYLTPKRSREELYNRINKRSKIILKSGLIQEVQKLINKGYSFSKPAMSAISYPIVKQYLDREITKEELLERFAQGDRNYARRQVTWFKRYNAIKVEEDDVIMNEIKKFLSE
jgi:tRNA dimethylallyltransferase